MFAWEQRKLGDVAKITAGGDINKGDLINKGKYPVIANGLNNNGIVGYSNKYKIDAPAVTITGRGTLGVATARFINFTPIVRLISIKSDLDPIYLENVINNTHFVIESTGVPQLTAPQVKRQTVILSNCHIEQTKIGSLFLTLDNAITLHEEKKRQLERLKSALMQKMFADKSGYPPVRFEGFSNEWEHCKLGDVADFSKGTGYSKSDLKGTGSPIILYGRLYTKYETIIRNVDSFVVPKSGSVFSKGGEVIVPGSGETAEDISIASVVEPAGILLGGDLNIIYPNSDLDPTFLAITISNGKPHFDMARRAQGKSIVHLHNADLKHISLKTPNLSEQKRISKIFEVLDQTITLHDQKLNLLKLVKQSLLQNMFI
ncbi:restriction endonuclease subunit S [Lactobacillus delbrueckii subsp. bulgaricus]